MAPPARLELTTLRLGGVRSIQVSYGGIWKLFSTAGIVPVKFHGVNQKCANSQAARNILSGVALQRGGRVLNGVESCVDLDDLLFAEGDGLPSDR